MRRLSAALAALACVLVTAIGAVSAQARPETAVSALASPETVVNATQFTDTSGNPLHAHGGGVVKVGQYYYWFGENRNADNTFRYVSAYRSTDLVHWQFRNHVLTQASHPELAVANIERPKVMYNQATGTFVMWMHKENGADYSEARAAVAVSDTVDGDYTYQRSFRPLGHMSRDIGVFVDTDGAGYMYSSANENYDLHIYRLTSDFTDVATRVANPWPGAHREAPALFKRGSTYFMLTSGSTGWSPNQQRYATSTSLASGWSAMQNVGDSTGYGSQTTFVLPVQGTSGTSYLYMGDRWGNSIGTNVNGSRYVWAPITFPTSTSMSFGYYPELVIDAAAGTVTGQGGPFESLTARHSGRCADVTSQSYAAGAQIKQYDCNGGGNQRFWFRSSGSGYYNLVARHSTLCVQENATTVTQEHCGSGLDQQWSVVAASGSYVTIRSRATGECLDVNGGGTGNGAAVITYACSGASNQQWTRGS